MPSTSKRISLYLSLAINGSASRAASSLLKVDLPLPGRPVTTTNMPKR